MHTPAPSSSAAVSGLLYSSSLYTNPSDYVISSPMQEVMQKFNLDLEEQYGLISDSVRIINRMLLQRVEKSLSAGDCRVCLTFFKFMTVKVAYTEQQTTFMT